MNAAVVRTPGRPKLDPALRLEKRNVRLTDAQWEKLQSIGVEALRAWLDGQAEPEQEKGRGPSKAVRAGWSAIAAEMGVLADVKDGDGEKREAKQIRAALEWVGRSIE